VRQRSYALNCTSHAGSVSLPTQKAHCRGCRMVVRGSRQMSAAMQVTTRGGEDGGMTDDPFEACWYRWERADSHRRDMAQVWNASVERQTHDFELVHEGQGCVVWPLPAEHPKGKADSGTDRPPRTRCSLSALAMVRRLHRLESTAGAHGRGAGRGCRHQWSRVR
jgi:hypothetical protein